MRLSMLIAASAAVLIGCRRNPSPSSEDGAVRYLLTDTKTDSGETFFGNRKASTKLIVEEIKKFTVYRKTSPKGVELIALANRPTNTEDVQYVAIGEVDDDEVLDLSDIPTISACE